MKKQLILFTFLLLNITVSGQEKQRTVGLLISPNLNLKDPEERKDLRFSYTTGIYYDHQLTHRFGIYTGFLLDTERYRYDYSGIRTFDGELPKSARIRINAFEVPVNLTFCFNPDNESGYKAFLYSGIMLHREFFSKNTAYYDDKVVTYKGEGYNNGLWSVSYMNLGFEVRKDVGTHYSCAIGGNAKFRPVHSFNFASNNIDREPILINLNLKFGRNL